MPCNCSKTRVTALQYEYAASWGMLSPSSNSDLTVVVVGSRQLPDTGMPQMGGGNIPVPGNCLLILLLLRPSKFCLK